MHCWARTAQPHAGPGRHRLRRCRRRSVRAQARWNAGYRAFKIKVGLASPAADAGRTQAVCQFLEDKMRIVWSRPTPIRVSASTRAPLCACAIDDCGLDFFEQPVKSHALDAMARVAAATRLPSAPTKVSIRATTSSAIPSAGARGVSLKAIKLGGLREVIEACRLVRPVRHERQYFLQDRRVERRLGGGAACRCGGTGHRLGSDAHQPRFGRMSRSNRFMSPPAMPRFPIFPVSESRSTRTGCGAASKNSKEWREPTETSSESS